MSHITPTTYMVKNLSLTKCLFGALVFLKKSTLTIRRPNKDEDKKCRRNRQNVFLVLLNDKTKV